MDQLLLDAKRLASRLREHSGSTDTLIDQAKNLQFKLDAMKQVKWMKDNQGLSLIKINNIEIYVFIAKTFKTNKLSYCPRTWLTVVCETK